MVDWDELTDQQRWAATSFDRNIALTAGAGTGKTTTLTARYIRLLENGMDDGDPVFPHEIVTTTFTERAANDLLDNVRSEIIDKLANLDGAEFDRWRTVADALEDGYIHTLHGFCARLLREHSIRVDGIDPGFETLDETETTALIDDTVRTVLEEYDDHEAVEDLARRFDRSDLHAILTDLLTERPESLEWAETWAEMTDERYLDRVWNELHPIDQQEATDLLANPAVVGAIDELTGIVDSPPPIETGGNAWNRAAAVTDKIRNVSYADGKPTQEKQRVIADIADVLTKNNGERYSSYSGASSRWEGATEAKAQFDTAIETIVQQIEPESHVIDASIDADRAALPWIRSLAELTRIVAAEYEDRKRRRNAVDFTDQIAYVVSFLRDEANEDVRAALRDRLSFVMVDEFQDTDPRQWELVELLTSENPERFDARNVFVVGDVKQSIYRFRNADVTQFVETQAALGDANRPEVTAEPNSNDDQLSTNFRSLPRILTFVNELFDEVFVQDGPAYEASPQRLDPLRTDPAEVGTVEYLAVPTDPDLREARFGDFEEFAMMQPEADAELEAKALAAKLTQLLAEPYLIYPEGESDEDEAGEDEPPGPVEIEPQDVAILLRSRTHLKAYERALADHDIPYSVASGLGFYDTPEITTLINLLKALADPGDERALYGVLRSPLFGFSDDTIAPLKQQGEDLWTALSMADNEELGAAYSQLAQWRSHAGTNGSSSRTDPSWAAFLTRIIEETGYLISISADERPRQAVANVEKFRDQLRGWNDEGIQSLVTLIDRIERRIELGSREGEADVLEEAEGVQIMTIHDAKGMEFPMVVIPGIGRGFNDKAALGNGRVEFETINETPTIGMKAPNPEDPFDTVDTLARLGVRQQRRAEERAEEKRILYVACTRARDHLLLSGLHDCEEDVEPGLDALEPAEPDDPASWRDMVQPHLLSDTAVTELPSQTEAVQQIGEARVTVSLPTAPVTWEDEQAIEEPELSLSPTPSEPEARFSLTPSSISKLFAGEGTLSLDEETNQVMFEQSTEEEYVADRSKEFDVEIAATTFGQLVHRLCELRPPRDLWIEVVERTLKDLETVMDISDVEIDRVYEHVVRALAYRDSLHPGLSVQSDYDELSVTAEFENGEITGVIDHLVVTEEAFYLLDYKTGGLATDDIEDKANYYRPQLEAYAIALHQQDPTRDIIASLHFTEIDEAWSLEWSADVLDDLGMEMERELQELISSLT